MYKEALRPAWVEVNLTNLEYNIKNIQAKAGDRPLIGVIKADAYGHGAEEVARVLVDNGVKTLAIATLHEAIALREAGFVEQEIIMLGLTPDMYADTIVEYNITPVTCSYENAKAISEAAAKAGNYELAKTEIQDYYRRHFDEKASNQTSINAKNLSYHRLMYEYLSRNAYPVSYISSFIYILLSL